MTDTGTMTVDRSVPTTRGGSQSITIPEERFMFDGSVGHPEQASVSLESIGDDVPNAETIAAIEEARTAHSASFVSMEALLKDLRS